MTKKDKKEKINEYKSKVHAIVVQDMKQLGVYKPEFNGIIDLYVDMVAQYNLAWDEFVESGCVAECKTKAGGVRKTAALTTMEELRRQIGTYADRLCITPKTQKAEEQKAGSKLEQVFAEIEKLQSGV